MIRSAVCGSSTRRFIRFTSSPTTAANCWWRWARKTFRETTRPISADPRMWRSCPTAGFW